MLGETDLAFVGVSEFMGQPLPSGVAGLLAIELEAGVDRIRPCRFAFGRGKEDGLLDTVR